MPLQSVAPTIMFTILICAVVLILSAVCWKQIVKYGSINKLPGPQIKELLQFGFTNKSSEDIYHYYLKLHERFGPVIQIWVKPFRPMVMVADFKLAQKILMSSQQISKPPLYDLLKPYIGNGLGVIREDDIWRKDRKAFNHAFDTKTLEEYTYMHRQHTEQLFDKIKQKENQPIELQALLSDCILDIIIECLTGEQVASEDKQKYHEARDIYMRLFLERAYSSLKSNHLVYRLFPDYKKWAMTSKILNKIPSQILEKHIADKDNTNTTKFMQTIKTNGMPYARMLGHLSLFVAGGHDTTAQAVAFTLHSIAQMPEVQQKIYDEYITVIGNDKIADITVKDTEKMKYLECVIKESLRRYPMTTFIQRRLKSDCIMGDVKLPAGADVTISIASMQLSSRYYQNPLEFNPDRFQHGTDNCAYLPFSLGPRNCIAAKLAMILMKILISHIVRNFELQPVKPDHHMRLVGEWVLKSMNGIPVMMKQRRI